jgi:hypothetical protein
VRPLTGAKVLALRTGSHSLHFRRDVFGVRGITVICFLLSLQLYLSALPRTEDIALSNGSDDDVREFRLGELETALQAMHAGPERNYFEGILANRKGHIDDSIRC